MNIEKGKLKKILLLVFFTFIVFLFYVISVSKTDICFQGLALLSFVSLFLFFVTKACKLLSITWFIVVCLYVYNCGQVWLNLVNYDFKYSSFLISQFSNEDISKALFFYLMVINILEIFLIGFEHIADEDDSRYNEKHKNKIEYNFALKTVLIVFSIFCFPIVTYNDIQSIRLARSYGYLESYTTGRSNAIVYMMIDLLPLLIILWMFIGNKEAKKTVMIYAVFRSAILMFTVGNRGQYIALLIIVFLINELVLKNNTSKPKKFSQHIGVIAVGLVLLSVAGYVSNIRNIVNKSESFTEYLLKENFVFSMLQELGGTFINTILVTKNCPDKLPFAYGKTYMAAFIQLIPKGSSLISSYAQYVNLGAELNKYFSKGFGLGGSFIAELYYNFSWLSLGIVPVFSYILTKCDYLIHSKSVGVLCKSIAFYYSYVALMYIRGEFCDFSVYTRYLLYFLATYWIIKNRKRVS